MRWYEPQQSQTKGTQTMKYRRALQLSAGLALIGLVATGCGTISDQGNGAEGATAERPDKIETLVFDHPFTALPVVAAITSYAQERADELGIELSLTNANMDPTQQVTQLNAFVARTPDAIVSFPADPASIQSIATQFMDAGTYWISYANPLESDDGFLDLDAMDAGRALGEDAGEWINENLGGTGKVLIIEETSMAFSQARTAGVLEGLKKTAPNATIVAQQPGVVPEQGLAVTSTVLAQHPDLNVVLTVSGDAAQGAYQALIAGGRDPMDERTYVGGVDGNAFGLQRMGEGTFFRAQVLNLPEEVGNAVVDIPVAVAAGKDESDVVIPFHLITKDSPELDQLISDFGG